MVKKLVFLGILFTLVFSGCAINETNNAPTEAIKFLTPNPQVITVTKQINMPNPTVTSTLLPTITETRIPSLTPTPTIIFQTIGSPFPPEWGSPRIWSNNSFNGKFSFEYFDKDHGHMDVAVPVGYSNNDGFDLDEHIGDVIAPISGYVQSYQDNSLGLHLTLKKSTYLDGIVEALQFAGIENPEIEKISEIIIDIGHLKDVRNGYVDKGDVIAEIEPKGFNVEGMFYESGIAFLIYLRYDGIDYQLSPTLFTLDQEWLCYELSMYSSFVDCEPESNYYAP